MNKYIIALLINCLLLSTADALIIEIRNLDSFEQALIDTDEQTLVLLDVDETLIVPKDQIFTPNAKPIWNKYAKMTIGNPEIVPPGKYEDDYFLGEVLSKTEYELVDAKMVDLIHSLQKRGIKTIAFTKMITGKLGQIASMEDWRLECLKKLDLDFNVAFPEFQQFKIEALNANGRCSLFKQGLLAANKQDKGPVLIAFLKHIGWKPLKIIFIDNRLDYLQSVEESLSGTGIDFTGYYYQEVESRNCDVNEQLVEFQLLHLATHGEWLSDKEALKQMAPWSPIQMHSLQELDAEIEASDNNALFIFDVDEVLLTTIDSFGRSEYSEWFFNKAKQKIKDAQSIEERQELENRFSLVMLKPQRILVESITPDLIKKIQNKGIKTIALTHCPTGKMGVVPKIEHWRINQLKEFGIDFSLAFPLIRELKLTEIAKHDHPAPLFEEGVLFSAYYTKGEVLEAFLKRIDFKPSKVIFVDDLEENHHSVKQQIVAQGIPYIGFHYLLAKLPKEKVNFELVEFQFNTLMTTGEWLSDQEALKLMDLTISKL